MSIRTALTITAALVIAAPALAQDAHQHHMSGGAPMSNDVVIKAYENASTKMHKDMAVELTGDADVDFVRGMIPHHQGAIDMAKIVLEHGKDPDIRKLAEAVVSAQEGEIAFMREWLKKNGK